MELRGLSVTTPRVGAVAYVVSVGLLAGTSTATGKPAWYIATVAATLPLGIGFPVALFFALGLVAAVVGLDLDGGNDSWPVACLQVGLSAGLWMGLAWVNAKLLGDFVGSCSRRRLVCRAARL